MSAYGSVFGGQRTAYTSISTFLGTKHDMLENSAVFVCSFVYLFVLVVKGVKSQRCCCSVGVIEPLEYMSLGRVRDFLLLFFLVCECFTGVVQNSTCAFFRTVRA